MRKSLLLSRRFWTTDFGVFDLIGKNTKETERVTKDVYFRIEQRVYEDIMRQRRILGCVRIKNSGRLDGSRSRRVIYRRRPATVLMILKMPK